MEQKQQIIHQLKKQISSQERFKQPNYLEQKKDMERLSQPTNRNMFDSKFKSNFFLELDREQRTQLKDIISNRNKKIEVIQKLSKQTQDQDETKFTFRSMTARLQRKVFQQHSSSNSKLIASSPKKINDEKKINDQFQITATLKENLKQLELQEGFNQQQKSFQKQMEIRREFQQKMQQKIIDEIQNRFQKDEFDKEFNDFILKEVVQLQFLNNNLKKNFDTVYNYKQISCYQFYKSLEKILIKNCNCYQYEGNNTELLGIAEKIKNYNNQAAQIKQSEKSVQNSIQNTLQDEYLISSYTSINAQEKEQLPTFGGLLSQNQLDNNSQQQIQQNSNQEIQCIVKYEKINGLIIIEYPQLKQKNIIPLKQLSKKNMDFTINIQSQLGNVTLKFKENPQISPQIPIKKQNKLQKDNAKIGSLFLEQQMNKFENLEQYQAMEQIGDKQKKQINEKLSSYNNAQQLKQKILRPGKKLVKLLQVQEQVKQDLKQEFLKRSIQKQMIEEQKLKDFNKFLKEIKPKEKKIKSVNVCNLCFDKKEMLIQFLYKLYNFDIQIESENQNLMEAAQTIVKNMSNYDQNIQEYVKFLNSVCNYIRKGIQSCIYVLPHHASYFEKTFKLLLFINEAFVFKQQTNLSHLKSFKKEDKNTKNTNKIGKPQQIDTIESQQQNQNI